MRKWGSSGIGKVIGMHHGMSSSVWVVIITVSYVYVQKTTTNKKDTEEGRE